MYIGRRQGRQGNFQRRMLDSEDSYCILEERGSAVKIVHLPPGQRFAQQM